MFHTASRITRKLSRRFLFIYSILFGLLSFVILGFAGFLLYYQTSQTASAQINITSDSVNFYQKELIDKVYLLTSMKGLTDRLEYYKNAPDISNYEKINLYLSEYQSGDAMLRYISLKAPNGKVFHSLNHYGSGIQEFLEEQPHYQELLSRTSSYISPVLTEGFTDSSPYCYYLSNQTICGQDFLVAICYDAQALVKNITTASQGLSAFSLYNVQEELLYHFGSNTDTTFSDFLNTADNTVQHVFRTDGLHFYLSSYESSIYIEGNIFWTALMKNFFLLALCLLLLYFVPLAAALLYLIPVNEQLLHPITLLADQVHDFSLGDSAVDIYRTNDEIEDLSIAFHKMTANITRQANELAIQERKEAITYYKLLATQTDPHFIYNTMNIINILARQGNFEEIIQVNTALTRVLRERLNTQNVIFERIEKEVEALKQYQLIMNYRYHNRVSFTYDIDPAVSLCLIPKNILQPLAENSYYHGLIQEDGTIRGNIDLAIYEMNQQIIIELSDNGIGISPEHLTALHKTLLSPPALVSDKATAHIGIENIYRRVQYLYHNHFSMDIQSTPGHGTTVSLSLPLSPPEDNNKNGS